MTANECRAILYFSLTLNSAQHVARHVAWTRRGQKESPATEGNQIATRRDAKPNNPSEVLTASI